MKPEIIRLLNKFTVRSSADPNRSRTARALDVCDLDFSHQGGKREEMFPPSLSSSILLIISNSHGANTTLQVVTLTGGAVKVMA